MPYCSHCGVEVDEFVELCPLCNSPIRKFSGREEIPKNQYPETNPETVTEKSIEDKRNLYLTWMIFSILLFTPFFVILTIGIQLNGLKTWAGYPLSSLVAAWICSTLFLIFIRKPLVLSTGIMITVGVLLFIFDNLGGKIKWFFPLGLPLLILLYVLSILVIILSINIKDKGLNIGGFILIAAGIFNFGLDIMLSRFYTGKIAPSWSFVAISLFFPLALFFLALHYILKRKIKFKRFFHL